MTTPPESPRRVSLITLGCARNDVDSEELAGRLAADGWRLVEADEAADVVMVNTCGFIEQAKRESVQTILDVAEGDTTPTVVAVGCMAERYGAELAAELPEATVLGFDDYAQISRRLQDILAGRPSEPRLPSDRRRLLPISPVERAGAGDDAPGHAAVGHRLVSTGPSAPVKLASGCDRRCTFCAIPSFRGAFVSRRPVDVLADVRAMAADGVREVVLVSENSTSYGKDLGDIRLLETMLPDLGGVPGLEWVRVSYLQPAEMRPGLITAIADTPGIAPYFDLSFQHASPTVLRRMRRYGDSASFLELIQRIRAAAPHAGLRSNFIVGFPGETESDVAELAAFISAASLDAIGVFGYSDEDGTEAASLPSHHDEAEVAARVDSIASLADAVMADTAESRVGQTDRLLVEYSAAGEVEGRCSHQGPEDSRTSLAVPPDGVAAGDVLDVRIIGADGADLVAEVLR